MISHYLPSGSKIGAGYQAHYMANALCRAGHQVTMHSLCPHGEDALYQTVQIDAGRRLRTFRFAWELRKVDWSRFDVVHAHGDDYWLFGLPKKPPHVRTMHGSCLAEALHHPGFTGKLRMALIGVSEVMATFVADGTYCVSENTRPYYPWVKNVIVNGVDTGAFHPDGAKEARPTVLFVGTYQNRKRGKLLMDAFERTVRPALPDAQLWMVCSDAPAAPNVTRFGRVPTDQLTDLYRRAWVFCLPSSYEGFGVPYIEAMASGTPVVAAPNVGAVEVLDRGMYGVLSEPDGLGPAILGLLQDHERREQFRQLGLRRAQDYAWTRIVGLYEQVYAGLRRAAPPKVEAAPAR
jgi:glycosyltransferase involved in cell wall biosynthesis